MYLSWFHFHSDGFLSGKEKRTASTLYSSNDLNDYTQQLFLKPPAFSTEHDVGSAAFSSQPPAISERGP